MFQHGVALAANDFNGGIQQVVTPLHDLGFEVLTQAELADFNSIKSGSQDPETFIVLWNPDGWSWGVGTRARNQQEIREMGVLMDQWSLGGRRGGVREGDRFFLLKVGELPRGIIAAGRALGPAFEQTHWEEGYANSSTFLPNRVKWYYYSG